MKYIIAWIRIILLVIILIIFLFIILLSVLILGRSVERGFKIRRLCVNIFLKLLGFRIHVHGNLKAHTPAVYVANHRCFSDPLLALKFFYFFPIGKAEVEHYPLIGLAARETGVLFVKRDNKESRNNVKEGIKKALLSNINIFLCPEGTTNVGQTTKEFKKGAFDVAVELKVPVLPIALVYQDPASDFWIPGDSLLQHFIRQFGKWRTVVSLYVPDQPFHSTDSILLMNECKNWIDDKLNLVEVPKEVSDLAVYNLKV